MYSFLTPLSSCSRFCMPCLVNDLYSTKLTTSLFSVSQLIRIGYLGRKHPRRKVTTKTSLYLIVTLSIL